MKTLNKFVNSQFLRSLICVCLFCIPLTSSAQPMRGAYTIDPAGSGPRNFISFTTALQALGPAGIDSAIVFNVADGDYYEMLQIGSISGASAVNTITFQGDENDSTKVRLWMETNDYRFPFTMHFNSYASHYIFRKMTIEGTGSYANVILTDQAGYLKGNVIENCLLKGKQTSSTSVDYAIYYDRGEQTLTENAFITFRNNLFVDGSYGIFSYSRTSEARLENFEITGNQFINQSKAGIFLNNCPEATINNNYFYLIRENVHGICLENCDKDISIQGNTIIITKGGLPGLVLRDCDGNVLDKGLIANNFITVDGTLTGYGIQLDTSTYQMIFHNSINIINTNAGSAALLGNGGDHNEVRNNIFSNTGGGYAYFLMTTSAVSSSDYNNYFSNWNTLARWGIIDQPTLDDLRTANNDDAHSVSVNPGFYSSDDLHTNAYWLDGMGDPGTGITTDIDGETRSSPPDIGADEFTSTTLPLAGTYKIGGSSPHYAKIKDAFDDLQAKGVMGPTTFEIRDENYNEHIGWVYEIPGADENDTIVFKSESGNPENVILHYSTDIFDRIIIGLNGIDHLTIQDISIAVTGEAYGLALYSRGNCENINILNNHLASANTADNVVQITEGIKHDIVIENNTFSKGLHSLVFGGLENNLVTNSIVSNNIFSGAEIQAIEIFYHHSPSIMNNTITNKELATGEPILVYNCEGNLKISGNIIINALGDFGIKLDNCIAISPFTGLVANNMIQVGDNLTAYGILVENSKRMNLYHNTVNITSSDTVNGRAIYIHDNNEEINLVNNIIANSGGGYALFVNDPTDIILSDYNGLYSSGTNFLSWGGTDYFSLDSMIAASGMDDHSLSVDPKFVSETDLHSRQFSFMGAATPLEEVKYDIVNHPRDALNPDIGAIEFWCETPDFNIFVSTACYGDTTLFIDNSSNITEGASYEWDFDGNFSPEIYSDIPNDTLMYHYDTSGVYTLVFIVHQLEGCDDWTSVPVRVVALPVLDITAEGAYCDNNDGQATVSIIDGGGTYTYYWSTGSTDSIVRDLALGTYTVAVSDSNGCTSNGEITIEEAIRVEVTELQSSTCGKSDGIAEVSVSGGIEPYEIVWSSGGTSAVDSFLAPGLHYVNVIDANECYARGSVVIGNDGSGPEIKLESKMDNLCFGDMMGFIDISISGGETPYDILWSNGSRTEDLENLAAGIYNVIVKPDICLT